jgi:two-component system sensor histidine kinase NblS
VKQQSLIATMADGAILLDATGRIVLANPTSRRLFRWEGRSLEGQELVEELPELLSDRSPQRSGCPPVQQLGQ